MKISGQNFGDRYVLSRKPSPVIFISWNVDDAEKQLSDFLDVAKGFHVELIMKDISTVGYRPHNLWEWAEIAMKVVNKKHL